MIAFVAKVWDARFLLRLTLQITFLVIVVQLQGGLEISESATCSVILYTRS